MHTSHLHPFSTPDGRLTGWKAIVPGGRPLAL